MTRPCLLRSAAGVVLIGTVACQQAAIERAPAPGTGPAAPPIAPPVTPGPAIDIPDAAADVAAPAPMACAMSVHRAERAPVDLVLLVDASGSMDELSGAQTKWERTRGALGAFVRDPASAGLGVGLSFFPSRALSEDRACQSDGDCAGLSDPITRSCLRSGVCYAPGLPFGDRVCAPGANNIFNCPAGMECRTRGRCAVSGAVCVEAGAACPGGAAGDVCTIVAGRCRNPVESCSLAHYGRFDVDIGVLPARADGVVAALAARAPDGMTPMTLAVESAMLALTARQKTAPDRRAALVLATDGLPSGCGGDQNVDTVTARITAGRATTPGIPTYVVGVFAADEIATAEPALRRFATAGGTRAPFILTTGNDLGDRLLEALKEIRGAVVACDYGIPQAQAGAIDFGKVNVRTTSAGNSEELAQVPAADRCGDRGGWYYDPAPAPAGAPARVVLCPATCARLKPDPAARVELVFGCATRTID